MTIKNKEYIIKKKQTLGNEDKYLTIDNEGFIVFPSINKNMIAEVEQLAKGNVHPYDPDIGIATGLSELILEKDGKKNEANFYAFAVLV